MKCPSCGYLQRAENRIDCEACGLIFAKWEARHHATKTPSIPSELEIHGYVYTSGFWTNFLSRQMFFILTMACLLLVISFHPKNIFWFILPAALAVLQALSSIVFLVLRARRRMAVLTPSSLEFASPDWTGLFPKWHKAQWTDVASVRSVKGVFSRGNRVYLVAADVRIPGGEKPETFGVQFNHPLYVDFLRYLSVKVDPLKMDPEVRELLKPDNLKNFLAFQTTGMKYGSYMILAMGLLYICVSLGFHNVKWSGIPVRILFLFPIAIAANFLKPPSSRQ